MNKGIFRRDFLKRLGPLAAAPVLIPGRDFFKETKRKLVLLFKRRNIEIPDYSDIPRRTGVPICDFLISLDYPKQRLQCTCAFTLDGSVVHYCEEGGRLARERYEAGVELQKHFPDSAGVRTAFREYLKAEQALRKHYWSN